MSEAQDLDPAYVIDTDPQRLDLARVHEWLSTGAFWALGRSREVIERAAAGSVNFGAYSADGEQVGYARVVTDHATFGWLCDVYVASEHRGRGVGEALAWAATEYVEPLGLARFVLSTVDAHELYARHGFVAYPTPERLMLHSPRA